MKEYTFAELAKKSGKELEEIKLKKEKELDEAIKHKGRLCARIQLLQEQIKEEHGIALSNKEKDHEMPSL
ncbi:MAG: hypothetical protein ACTSVO_05670 [Candidatus Heimdallarchaeaceae archaeon]